MNYKYCAKEDFAEVQYNKWRGVKRLQYQAKGTERKTRNY